MGQIEGAVVGERRIAQPVEMTSRTRAAISKLAKVQKNKEKEQRTVSEKKVDAGATDEEEVV